MAYENLEVNKTQENKIEEVHIIKEIDIDKQIEESLKNKVNLNQELWEIEIPAISLTAPIAEGTTQEIMREYVGHFENTSLWKGNIGLAAHNRRFSN